MTTPQTTIIVDEHTQAPPSKATFTPGDNPNKSNYSKRKNNRLQTKNKPREESEKSDNSFKWYDPLPTVEPAAHDLAPHIESIPAGIISLKGDLPSAIARPFCDGFTSVTGRMNLADHVVRDCDRAIEASSYFKAARQLYSTLSDPVKTTLQPLKAVFYDSAAIPQRMSAAMAMIGDMDTKLGQIQIQDPVVLFKRWVAKGIIISGIETSSSYEEADQFIWVDRGSKAMINRLATAKLAEFCSFSYTLDVPSGDIVNTIAVRPPIPEATQAGFDSVDASNGRAASIRLMVALLAQTERQFLAQDDLPFGQPFEDALIRIGLRQAPDEFSEQEMRFNFEEFSASYLTLWKPHIGAVFTLGDGPTSGHGHLAQLVKSTDVKATFPLPMSDSDRHAGFMFDPNESFTLSSSYGAYAKRQRKVEQASFAAKDFRDIAK